MKYASLDITGNSIEALKLERTIREKGREIILIAENLSTTARNNTRAFVLSSQWTLIISIVFLCIIGCLVGQLLSRMVIKPLRMLEESMKQVANGRFNPISITTTDSEIISLNRAFNRMLSELDMRQKQLTQSEKLASLGTLLSGIAHQLNNPLSNISTSCQILIEEIEEKNLTYKKELLTAIESETDRARDIVRTLLEFSREKEFNLEVLPLKILVEETLKLLRGQIPTEVEVSINIPEGFTIFVDKQKIEQVCLNLINNAIEAIMEEGTITISARLNREKDMVEIEIKDTGIGIEPQVLPRIFDPFFTTKETGKGAGIGLFIVHDIIERHGGTISVESKVGEGTRFLIRLPHKEA